MKTDRKALFVIVVLIVIVIAMYILVINNIESPFIKISGYFDKDGNEISNPLSLVKGITGVKYITIDINVKNEDSVPLTVKIIGASPSSFKDALPENEVEIMPGDKTTFKSDLIDIEQYEGQEVSFSVKVEASSPFRKSQTKEGTLLVNIEPDPSANFSVSVSDIDTSNSVVNPGCEEDWQCSEWSECINSIQTRYCVDLNECGTSINKPETEKICDSKPIEFSTNAVNGNYKDRDVWIKINDREYRYKGQSSYKCLSENVILTTPEGYEICSRPGYDVGDRVYLQYNNLGLIFR